MINIKGVNKYFNKGKQNQLHVINNVTMQLPEKGMVAMFGKSGCGKTTLLNVIGGLDKFAGGSIEIFGKSISQNTDVLRNQYIGYIFQNYNLNKSKSCFDNVADALRLCGVTDKNEIERRVCAALANVDMEKYKKRTPDTLSGGQQQRIAIARAIVKNPKIILADEPTGNLDEANTVKIMNLLKAISRDHLVLIVTHEANLVDYYCDTVIELADGKITNVRHNDSAYGFEARDKNTIYLGELEKRQVKSSDVNVEYYGNASDKPVSIKIINNGGKLYLSVDDPSVHVLDSTSEVKLNYGVYKETAREEINAESVDMSALPPINGKNHGKLFSFADSLKAGFEANFKHNKKSSKLLRRCMTVFALTLVFMSAVFGTSIDDMLNASDEYNHNVYYVYTSDGEISQQLYNAAQNGENGIDFISTTPVSDLKNEKLNFSCGAFETFETFLAGDLTATASFLSETLAKDLTALAGKNTGISDSEMIITSKVADKLLETSSLGYISEYRDLVGLISRDRGSIFRIAGVVKSSETAVYLTESAIAKRSVENSNSYFVSDKNLSLKVQPGTTVIVKGMYDETELPSAGQTVKINGLPFKVEKVIIPSTDYRTWLTENGIKKLERDEFFRNAVKESHPGISEEEEDFYRYFDEAMLNDYYKYFEYFYAESDRYLAERYAVDQSIELWIYFEKNIADIKYQILGDYEYMMMVKYKEKYGNYPPYDKLYEFESEIKGEYDNINDLIAMYSDEYYMTDADLVGGDTRCILNDDDFLKASKLVGETHRVAMMNKYYYYNEGYDKEVNVEFSEELNGSYVMLHSNDTSVTEDWLKDNFSSLPQYKYSPYDSAVVTPNDIFKSVTKENISGMIAGIITIGVVLVIMSVCMYFIMRSSLMNRIKEVGIYRAIGVTKKNLSYKFFVEANILAICTVLVGYLLSSVFLIMCTSSSSLMSQVFFYPAWYAIAILIILYAVCIICGILPIISLLRKTPSEILAKYDI